MTPHRWADAARRSCSALVALAMTTLIVTVATPTASAVTPLSTTSTQVTVVPPNATTALTGASVAGMEDDTNLQVTVSTDVGTLALTDTGNLSLAFGNQWDGTPSITFSGIRADLNAGLATLAITTTSGDVSATATVTVTALLTRAGFVYSPSNQHFYEYVAAPGLDWDSARTLAKERTFLGQQGYLATIPSAEINELVSSRIDGAENVWFGARSDDVYPYRYWRWADGPLAGQEIITCTNWMFGCDSITDPGIYNGWAANEPNNYDGEWVAVTNWGGQRGNWNDLSAYAMTSGFVVEYGDQAIGASTPFSGVATSSSAVDVRGVPDAPTSVGAVRGNSTATVTFEAPASDGGTPITEYTVTGQPDGGNTVCPSSPCSVTGLINGTGYRFEVRAHNAIGTSLPSALSQPVIPATVPGAPTDIRLTPGDGSASVTFTAPAVNGGSQVTGYVVTVDQTGEETVCTDALCVVDGLENGRSYDVSVQAVNDVGRSAASSSSAVTPAGAPSPPGDVTATRGNGSAIVTFTEPADDGGADISGYHVTGTPDGAVTECASSPCEVLGLTNGTSYTFTVTALNQAGLSRPSDPSSAVTPATVPGAPTAVGVQRGDQSATVTFGAPADDGGSTITGYEISLDDGDTWTSLAITGDIDLTASIDGLTNGTTYDVLVRAVNEIGGGEAASDLAVTPARRPGTPTDVVAVRGDQQATVYFTAPDSNGSPVTGYTVTVTPGGEAVNCDASPCVVTGLTNGTDYTFTLVATNDLGNSKESADSQPVTPAGVPGAPSVVRSISVDQGLLVGFNRPASANGSAVFGYQISLDGGAQWAPLGTHETIDGEIVGFVGSLTNGTSYQVAIRAVNGVGSGAAAVVGAITPAGRPGQVSLLGVTAAKGKVTVSWKAPLSDGGAAITGYRVVAAPGGASCETTKTSCTFSGLPTGVSYTFTVTASNTHPGQAGTGTGPGKTSSKVLVTGLPSAPQALKVSPGDRRLAVSFRPPATNGGTKVTGYQLSTDGGKTWKKPTTSGTSALKVTVAPVLNGAKFSVTVRAVNAVGAGKAAGPVKVTTVQWFQDPVSKAAKGKQVSVPKKPASYRGPVRSTKATMRSADGKVAMSGASLRGRQLQAGQAANLDTLFAWDNATLTSKGKAQVKAFAGSLRYVKAVTCEGYADFGGLASHEKKLSVRRADVVCDLVKRYAPQVTSRKEKAYGAARPVVLGGRTTDRSANRRVVVLVRG